MADENDFEDFFGNSSDDQIKPEEKPPTTEAVATGEENNAEVTTTEATTEEEPGEKTTPAAPPAANLEKVVPVEVFTAQRRDLSEKLKAKDSTIADLQAKLAAHDAKKTVLSEAPDKFDDPDGYDAFMLQKIEDARASAREEAQIAVIADRVARSEASWVEKLGGTSEGSDWSRMNAWIAAQPDTVVQAFQSELDPYGAANRAWMKAQTVEQIGDKTFEQIKEEIIAAEKERIIAEYVASQNGGEAPQAKPSSAKPAAQAQPALKSPPAVPAKIANTPAPQTRRPANLAALTGNANAAVSQQAPDREADFDNLFGQGMPG